MLAIIRCRILCLSVCYPKYKDQDVQNYTLPVVLYGYETWLLTLREECSSRVSENRVLRRIYKPKRDEVMGVEKTA